MLLFLGNWIPAPSEAGPDLDGIEQRISNYEGQEGLIDYVKRRRIFDIDYLG